MRFLQQSHLIKFLWKKGWFSFLTIAFCFIYLLKISWLKWGDLIIDSGREMYVPLKLVTGARLYRDIFYHYGPFSPYFNAFLYKIAGVHIHSLIINGIITTCFTCLLLYKISRIFLNIFFSTFVVLVFLFVFAFGYYVYLGNYNFILPYSYPVINAIAFSLAGYYFFWRLLRFRTIKYGLLLALFTFLVLSCRIEIGFSFIFSVLAGLLISRMLEKSAIFLALGFVLAALLYVLLGLSGEGAFLNGALLNTIAANLRASDTFTGWLSGIANLQENTQTIFKVVVFYLFLCGVFFCGGSVLVKITRFRGASLRRAIYFIFAAIIIYAVFLFLKKFFYFELQYRCLPLMYLLVGILSLRRFYRCPDKANHALLFSLSLFAFILILRMPFFVRAGHYGFFILVPGLIVYHVFFFKILPDALRNKIIKASFCLGFLAVFIWFAAQHFLLAKFCYDNRTLEVSSERGKLFVFNNNRERRSLQLIEFLKQNTHKSDTLVIFPEGVAINFLSGRDNPLYHYSYLPPELSCGRVVEEIIADLEKKKVTYVALVQRDTGEYGFPAFGRDYATKIWEYVARNYLLYKQFGPYPFTSDDFGIALFKNKSSYAPNSI
ncbi:MAG: hypothetical protein WC628_00835 [Candidatus Omnitrophota bacterium]